MLTNHDRVNALYKQLFEGIEWEEIDKQSFDDRVLKPISEIAPRYKVLFEIMEHWERLREAASQVNRGKKSSSQSGRTGGVIAVDMGMLGNGVDTWIYDSFYQEVTEETADLATELKKANWKYRRTFFASKSYLGDYEVRSSVIDVLLDQIRAGVEVGVVLLTDDEINNWDSDKIADFNHVFFPNKEENIIFSLATFKLKDSRTIIVSPSNFEKYGYGSVKTSCFFSKTGLGEGELPNKLWRRKVLWFSNGQDKNAAVKWLFDTALQYDYIS